MRIRSTKPEFWRSERIARVSWEARLVLKALESYVDDNGVGKDDLALIVGDLFQRDLIREPSRTLARVSEAISELSEAGLLWRYSADGTELIYLSFWDSIQRVDKPQAGRFPRPDGTMNYKDSEIREAVANPREGSRALAPVTGEQGNRGTGEQNSPSSADAAEDEPDPFDEFWTHYPRKVEKQDARKAWRAALKKTTASELIDAVKAYPFGDDPRYIKHAATWLNKGCWADSPDNVRAIRAVDPDHRFTGSELDDLLGADRWTCPDPPAGLDPDQQWEWRRQRQIEHIEERQGQARERAARA